MVNNRIKAKAKLYFDVDGESVTASEESLSDAVAKVNCNFPRQLFDPDTKSNHISTLVKYEASSYRLLLCKTNIFGSNRSPRCQDVVRAYVCLSIYDISQISL